MPPPYKFSLGINQENIFSSFAESSIGCRGARWTIGCCAANLIDFLSSPRHIATNIIIANQNLNKYSFNNEPLSVWNAIPDCRIHWQNNRHIHIQLWQWWPKPKQCNGQSVNHLRQDKMLAGFHHRDQLGLW